MKRMSLIFALALASATATAADLNLNASSLKLKVYKMAVSTSPLCTNLTTVIDNSSSPTEMELVGSVNMGTGTIANGTYPCIVIEFSDIIKFKPSANSDTGNCSTGTEAQLDVCQSGTSALIDGTTTTCTNGNDRVAMYISTASTSTTGSDAFNAPTSLSDSTKGFNLATALTVSGSSSGKFIVNPDGKVCDGANGSCDGGGGSTCRLMPPLFSFTKL
ncbi:MAG TPA: hypothetical protein DCL41_09380 [Bdellovibrionales bacterium]|nr:hypothetical protein [Bdellovibrionales bacterium]